MCAVFISSKSLKNIENSISVFISYKEQSQKYLVDYLNRIEMILNVKLSIHSRLKNETIAI